VLRGDDVTAIQLLRAADADYPIFSSPIMASVPTPIAPGSDILINKDVFDPNGRINTMRLHPVTREPQILGQAGKGYPMWTNEDVFCGFADEILRVGRPTASTCGVLRDGRQAFMSFELPEEIRPGGLTGDGEGVRVWMVVDTSYDQVTPTAARLTTIRPVCANTLRAGKAQKFAIYKIKKTKNADLKVKMAQKALGLADKFREAALDEWNQMLAIQLPDWRYEKVVTDLFGPGDSTDKAALTRWDIKLEKLRWLFSMDPTTANIRGTGYAAVNAVTKYADWETRVNQKAKPEGMTDDAARFLRSMSGEKSIKAPKVNIMDAVLALV
jgi:phage/plasmid-like protein (TIGR03299 family)